MSIVGSIAETFKSSSYDVAVVGLGAIGSAALHALSEFGLSTIGIDRFAPPHNNGSSHGDTRIMRQAIGEGSNYVPIVLRSNQILEELESDTRRKLIDRCGFIFITRDDAGTGHHGRSNFLGNCIKSAQNYGILHEHLGAAEISARFPQFIGLQGDEEAYFEPTGGLLRPELCIASFLEVAQARGAKIANNSQVVKIERCGSGVRIETDRGVIFAGAVIVCAGAWLTKLAPSVISRHLTVHRQSLHWFPLIDPSLYRPEASPTFVWTHGFRSTDQFYGFPPSAGEIKLAAEQYTDLFDPDSQFPNDRFEEGISLAQDHLAGRLAGISDTPARSSDCFYTATPDLDFLIDSDGDYRIQIVSACSGHGFKHAPAVGEAVSKMALNLPTDLDLSCFSAARFEGREGKRNHSL